ncbi:Scr1 family TA system antitoxin-like transcriptional regulator [Streptomyces sp. NPDC058682]|uniref:Scr1 family TA system antitoxin-like transcriptional regulator n=1 Tax=Streptomyces sp. NPDC058682 TaxID=3346596 RepID=UPI00365FB43C
MLTFADAPGKGTVHLERFTSDLYLEKRSDVDHYRVMYEHLQAKTLDPESTSQLIPHAGRSRARASDASSHQLRLLGHQRAEA